MTPAETGYNYTKDKNMKAIYISTILCILMTTSCKQSTTTVIKSSEAATSATKKAGEVDHYICFREDDLKALEMSVSFDTYDNALEVKYKGQSKPMFLTYIDEVIITPGNLATKTIYTEMVEGIESGTYEFTHSTNGDYAKYTRKIDGKVFKFTVDHEQTIVGSGYRETPCY